MQGLAQIAANGRPIVNIDSPVEADAAEEANAKPATYIGTNNVEAGEMAGEHMVERCPTVARSAAIGGISGDVTSGARLEGFTKGVGDRAHSSRPWPRTGSARRPSTQATTYSARQARPARASSSANDDMGLGIARAVANAGKTGQVKVISVDGIEDALAGGPGRRGLTASVAQYPYAIG